MQSNPFIINNLSIVSDYALFIFALPILLVLGLLTVKYKNLGDTVLGLLLLTLMVQSTKILHILQYSMIEHITIIHVIILLLTLFIFYIILLRNEENYKKVYIEYSILILLAMLGILVSMETTDLLTIFIALEMQAFSFYTLVSIKKANLFSAEGGLKYFLIGAIASACIIFATAMLYENTGFNDIAIIADLLPIPDINYLFSLGSLVIIMGLLFKIGAVPFHLWLPDAYQGASFYTMIFLAIFPKMALIYLLFTINTVLQQDLLIFVACIGSGIIGSIQAASQTKVKRFLAFGIIFNNTYFLAMLLIAGKQALFGLVESMSLYLISSFLIMATIYININEQTQLRFKSLRDLISLKKTNIFIAFTLSIAFFSAAGIPPFLGFYQKYIALLIIIEKLQNFVAIFLIIATILPVYYYLRTTKIMFFLNQSKHILTTNISNSIGQIIGNLLGLTCFFLFI